MTVNVTAEIVAIGTEILLGEITDTNSVFIARALRDTGVNVYYMTSVGDNEERIASAIRIAMSRSDIVITCGGLGPTVDDMTRQAVANATERGLTFHENLLAAIAERFASFRAQMTDNNRRQAYLPDQAVEIENPVGTAPAFAVDFHEKLVISLPGVPREMKFLMNERVIPLLRDRYRLEKTVIKAKVLRTAGIGESLLDSSIGDDLLKQSNPTIGLAAHAGHVDVRITAKADTEAQADVLIAEAEGVLRARVGKYVYGVNQETIEEAVHGALAAVGSQIAVVEAGIGRPVSGKLAEMPNGSDLVAESVVFGLPSDLAQALDTPELDLRALAENAARDAARRNRVQTAIAVVSLPQSAERRDTEAGTALAVYVEGMPIRSRAYGFGAQYDLAPVWAATWSLSMLWQMLQENASY